MSPTYFWVGNKSGNYFGLYQKDKSEFVHIILLLSSVVKSLLFSYSIICVNQKLFFHTDDQNIENAAHNPENIFEME